MNARDLAANVDPRAELGRLGKALAALRWVQGPGGNVSVKADEHLLVKASGKTLAEAGDEGGHARVSLDLVRRALAGDAASDGKVFATKPRPSLEAYFHALGGPVVAHTHAVGALLHACSSSTAVSSNDLGLRLLRIPYVTPGRGVAVAIAEILGDATSGAVLLSSHGLVVYAASVDDALATTRAVDEAARARVGAGDGGIHTEGRSIVETVEAHLVTLRAAGDDRASADGAGVHRALPMRRPPAGAPADRPGYLFPDVVICASTMLVDAIPEGADARAELAARAVNASGRAGVLADADGRRVAFAKSAAQLAQSLEVLAAHEWVEDILSARGECAYLAADEPARLLGLPSEQYRIRLTGGS